MKKTAATRRCDPTGVGLAACRQEPYSAKGARFLSSWADGAVTIHSHSTGVVVETFVTGQQFVLRTERGPE